MIYKQSNTQYVDYPLSSHTDRFDPNNEHQIQRLNAREDKSTYRFCSLHNHLAFEILLILQGRVNVQTGAGTFLAGCGEMFIFNPFEVHAVTTHGVDQTVSYRVINFDPSILLSKGSSTLDGLLNALEEGSLRFATHIPPTAPGAQELHAHVNRICDLYKDRDTSPACFLSLMAELFALLALLCNHQYLGKADKKNLSRTALFTQKVVRYVSEHYAEPISTEQIAAYLHFNKSYFCRMFKQAFGESFGEYLNGFRITVAKNLSVREYRSLAAIAEAVGYASYHVFSKNFRRVVGVSPSDYFG